MSVCHVWSAQITYLSTKEAQVAQLVEQWTENPRVGGSIPPLGTTFPMQLEFHSPAVVNEAMR